MKKPIAIFTILLMLSIGNFMRISANSGIRTVDFLSILAVGLFAGALLTQIIARKRDSDNK